MNERIKELAEQATKWAQQAQWSTDPRFGDRPFSDLYDEKFAELIKQAIYDEVKEELMEDELINAEPDRLNREYLKGCNGGIVDALCHIKNFGVDIDE